MSIDEYIQFAVQLLANSVVPGKTFVTAAEFGAKLRAAVAEENWSTHGYRSLTEFLRSLEGRGHVELITTSKGAMAVMLKGSHPPPQTPSSDAYNPLRKPVWLSFTMATPAGGRYLNRRSGHVRFGLQTAPTPLDEWVEITPVQDTEQLAWARSFADEAGLADKPAIIDALARSKWYLDFPTALEGESRALRHRWNQLRTAKVSAIAKEWAVTNDVDLGLVFQVGLAQGTQRAKPEAVVDASKPPLGDRRREWILAALATLPLERLLEIPLPAGALLDAINPQNASSS